MLKRLFAYVTILAFIISLSLPSSIVLAEADGEEEDAVPISVEVNENEESVTTVSEAGGSGGYLIYFLVVGYLVVICIGMYVFTEGKRKPKV